MFLNKHFDSERDCREWAKFCVSRGIQIDLLVAHHAQIFEEVRVRKHEPSKHSRGRFSELELKHITSENQGYQ